MSPRSSFRRLQVLLILTAIGAAGCGGNSTAPTPPPAALVLTCPAAQTVPSTTGLPVVVTYATPLAAGGTAPVATACAPLSGSSFPIGPTAVSCTAADAKRQTASCTFTVTVTAPPRIAVTRFVTFGDSITEGFPHTLQPALVSPAPPGSYPETLLSLLKGRYTADAITVLDEGLGGEIVANGVVRLSVVLNGQPAGGAMLLLEGANDLNQFGAAGVDAVVDGLQKMVRMARTRSMIVFLATLTPQRTGGKTASHPELVVPLNTRIRSLAASEGVFLVDLYQAFGGVADTTLISSDGLHPTTAGNQKIAETFYDAIRTRLEVVGTAQSLR